MPDCSQELNWRCLPNALLPRLLRRSGIVAVTRSTAYPLVIELNLQYRVAVMGLVLPSMTPHLLRISVFYSMNVNLHELQIATRAEILVQSQSPVQSRTTAPSGTAKSDMYEMTPIYGTPVIAISINVETVYLDCSLALSFDEGTRCRFSRISTAYVKSWNAVQTTSIEKRPKSVH